MKNSSAFLSCARRPSHLAFCFLLFASCLALAGCSILEFGGDIAAVGPAYKAPGIATNSVALPDAGQPTTNLTATGEYKPAASNEDTRVLLTTNEIARWWTVFEDPVLTNLIDRACASNRTYLIAIEHLRQSRAARMSAFSALLPHAGASASAIRSETSGHGTTYAIFGNGNRYHLDTFDAAFDASWEIDIFGGERRAVQAANREAMAQLYTVQDTWVSLAAEVGDAYVTLRTLQKRLDVARTNLVIQSDTLDILESRFKAGISDELAVNQARYNTEQTRASIPLILSSIEATMNELAVLAGVLPGDLHPVLTNCAVVCSPAIAPRRLEDLPMNTIRDRPDVRAAERHLAAAVANIGVAESLLLPKFYLNGNLGLQAVGVENLLSRKSLYGAIGPSVSWPLLQGGATLAQIEIAKSKMNEALLQYQLTVQQASLEVRNALSAYTQEYHRYKSLAAAVRAAADASKLAQERYKSGISDFNNVLDAQRSQLTLEEALTVSEGSIFRDLIALYKSLGGGL